MAFRFCESMIHQYHALGYVIFRQILPPSLIRDLRRSTANVQAFTRSKHGPQAQRLQPIREYGDILDLAPFREYAQLPPLVDAVQRVLSPRHKLSNGDPDRMGLLIEPAELPWCTAWHRDIREEHNPPDVEEFRRIVCDPMWFNQINCPIYEDNCTWFVPGSHHRRFDLPGEKAAAEPPQQQGTREERERANVEYCQAMPGAIRASMDAGDFMLYHPMGWHLGNYLPDRPRVTIHDWAPTPELLDWYDRWGKAQKAAEARKRDAAAASP